MATSPVAPAAPERDESPDCTDQSLTEERTRIFLARLCPSIAYPPVLGEMCRGKRGRNDRLGLMLAQIIHAHRPKRRDDPTSDGLAQVGDYRWLRRRRIDWTFEGFPPRTVDRMLKRLGQDDLGILVVRDTASPGTGGHNLTHIRVDWPAFWAAWDAAEARIQAEHESRLASSSPRSGERRVLASPPVQEARGEGRNGHASPVPTVSHESAGGASPADAPPAAHADPAGGASDQTLAHLANALAELGIEPPETASALAGALPAEHVAELITHYVERWQAEGLGPGYLRRRIERGDHAPKPSAAEQRAAAQAAQEREAAARAHQDRAQQREAAMTRLRGIWEGMSQEQRTALDQEARATLEPKSRTAPFARVLIEQARWRILADRRDIDLPEDPKP